VPSGITTTSSCFPLSLLYINNRRSQLIKQLRLDLHLCQTTLDFPLSNLVFELLLGSKTEVAFSKSSALWLATSHSLVTPSSSSTMSPMSPPPAPAAEQAPHPVVVDPHPGLAPAAPPLASHVTPPPPPPVPQPRYPLLAQFHLLNFETPPRHLFDRSPPPPQSPDAPAADPPNAGSPPCLLSRP
jgi:hypothetical protein